MSPAAAEPTMENLTRNQLRQTCGASHNADSKTKNLVVRKEATKPEAAKLEAAEPKASETKATEPKAVKPEAAECLSWLV